MNTDQMKVLKALASETRMHILELLLRHNYCVRTLARELQLTEATISQHLKVLSEAGLLVGEKRGYFMHYSVDRQVLFELAEQIKAWAELERESCLPEQHPDCPAQAKHNCSQHGSCSNEVRRFCHGVHHSQGKIDHGNGQGH